MQFLAAEHFFFVIFIIHFFGGEGIRSEHCIGRFPLFEHHSLFIRSRYLVAQIFGFFVFVSYHLQRVPYVVPYKYKLPSLLNSFGQDLVYKMVTDTVVVTIPGK